MNRLPADGDHDGQEVRDDPKARASPVCYAGDADPDYMWARLDAPDIRLKRIYDLAEEGDGQRILVDRLWPRGARKEAARVDLWLHGVAPSPALRKWFRHDPGRWEGFTQRYRDELAERPEALAKLLSAARAGRVTLLFAARERDRNHALILREVLMERLADGRDQTPR